MAVMISGTTEGMTAEIHDAINKEMNFPDEIPDGLLSHTAGPVEGGLKVVDVWESEAHFYAFVEGKLMPAMAKVGFELPGPPAPPEIVEVHNRWPG
jgi:hypothetical protein